MKSKQFQTGSAHLVIIILLVVALLGALGFVFYRNLQGERVTGKNTNPTKVIGANKAEDSSEIDLTEIAYDQTNITNFAIKYPKTWTYERLNLAEGENHVITSPDKKAIVYFQITKSSGVGKIYSNEVANESVKVNDKSDISGQSNIGFINYIDKYGIGYVGAYNVNTVKNNPTHEGYSESKYLLGYSTKDSTTYQSIVILKAEFIKKSYDDGRVDRDYDIDMNSENYKITKQIIQSLFEKN